MEETAAGGEKHILPHDGLHQKTIRTLSFLQREGGRGRERRAERKKERKMNKKERKRMKKKEKNKMSDSKSSQ